MEVSHFRRVGTGCNYPYLCRWLTGANGITATPCPARQSWGLAAPGPPQALCTQICHMVPAVMSLASRLHVEYWKDRTVNGTVLLLEMAVAY
jgi:hypothetical protein